MYGNLQSLFILVADNITLLTKKNLYITHTPHLILYKLNIFDYVRRKGYSDVWEDDDAILPKSVLRSVQSIDCMFYHPILLVLIYTFL